MKREIRLLIASYLLRLVFDIIPEDSPYKKELAMTFKNIRNTLI